MDKRLTLSKKLKTLGVHNVYFAPSVNNHMDYPCIRYEHSDRNAIYADDKRYIKTSSYTVTYITRNPDEAAAICEKLEDFKFSRYDRTYVTDGLYHYVYTITL